MANDEVWNVAFNAIDTMHNNSSNDVNELYNERESNAIGPCDCA